MKIDNFAQKITKEIEAFKNNMKNLGYENKSPDEWMEMYLNWTEWTTDMHDMCWREVEV